MVCPDFAVALPYHDLFLLFCRYGVSSTGPERVKSGVRSEVRTSPLPFDMP